MRAAVITVSDRSARGERPDLSGPAAADRLRRAGIEVVVEKVVPDEFKEVSAALRACCSPRGGIDVVITTGGTGLSPRDITPEATLSIIERPIPGIAEALRRAGAAKTPNAMLSRGVAGAVRTTLIINLPGSPAAVEDGMDVVLPIVEHAVGVLKGEAPDG